MSKQQQNLFDTDPPPWEMDDEQVLPVATVVFSEGPTQAYDYSIPDPWIAQLQPGQRVRVGLGRGNRTLVGYCIAVETKTCKRKLKPLKAIVDPEPLLSRVMLDLARWISENYLCPLGTTLEAIVPAGVRGQAGTREQMFLVVPTHVAARVTQLKLPQRQAEALLELIQHARPLTVAQLAQRVGCSTAPIQALIQKKLVQTFRERVSQFELQEADLPRQQPWNLNLDQEEAFQRIQESLRASDPKPILIHGITGSGKTEVYIRAIEEVIGYGRQAIVMVPEISLTPQTCQRFRSRFKSVAVLHSHLSPQERNWHWQRIARGEVQVVVGARSAVFAPVPRLGLIAMDEEHDSSFKQDTAPRYHARSVALKRTQLEGGLLLLGSATPSLESWHAAQTDRLRLVSMPHRVEGRPLPDVKVIDLRTTRSNFRGGGSISRPLGEAVTQALRSGGQVILLLNRRGFSTSIQCPACGHVVKCPQCDLALTHHREGESVQCHYCEHKALAPRLCPECQFEGIRYSGTGTQKLEAEVRARWAQFACLRMDSDTMRQHGSHEEALARFRSGEIKILVGTQMIAKGLDFPNVTLVGVINADTALHFPDFRASERTFQLVTQVAGRTGRGDQEGRVLVQSFSPEHPAIQAAMRHDYPKFAESELEVRKILRYPPYQYAARLVVRSDSEPHAHEFAKELASLLGQKMDTTSSIRLQGPAPAPIAKLRGRYRFHLIVYGPQRQALRDLVETVQAEIHEADRVQWIVDMDPVDML